MTFEFFLRSFLLGLGLSVDASVVCMANGMKNVQIPRLYFFLIPLIFSITQIVMPLIGYTVGRSFLSFFQPIIPFIALFLLCYLGIKSIVSGAKNPIEESETKLTIWTIILQAFATSFDSLSIGFTISQYSLFEALIFILIIGILTFMLSLLSLYIGKKFGTRFGAKTQIIGGILLILVGVEIFLTSIL